MGSEAALVSVRDYTCLVRGVLSSSLLDDDPRESQNAEGMVARAAVHLRDESVEGCRADGDEHESRFCLQVTRRHVCGLAAVHLGNTFPLAYVKHSLEALRHPNS